MAIWFSRSSKKSSDNYTGQFKTVVKSTISPYHCVEVKMPYDACEEVLKLHGKRFLSAEAPMLPVPGCDQHCSCKFKHYNDRRLDDRRDAFSSSGIHFSGENNRRLGVDRRHSSQSHVSVG
ncbi:MAG: hypothetical protein HKN83_10515 [Gammaproteobacteria bacterium]|nr:hypothetical protein [Gammaproteobacteria bacterium]